MYKFNQERIRSDIHIVTNKDKKHAPIQVYS